MNQSSKWIEGVKPEQLLTEVARQALRQRLRTVWDYAPMAAKKFEEDIEYVHQLRVATRRAGLRCKSLAIWSPKARGDG